MQATSKGIVLRFLMVFIEYHKSFGDHHSNQQIAKYHFQASFVQWCSVGIFCITHWNEHENTVSHQSIVLETK